MHEEIKMRSIAAYDSAVKKNGHQTYVSEWEIMKYELVNGFPEINSFGSLPDVPIVLLATGKNSTPTAKKSVIDLFENKMHNLSQVRFIDIGQSPHEIQNYDSFVVIENIRRVVFPDAEIILRKTLRSKGVDSCIVRYKNLKKTYPKEYMTERCLVDIGYEELRNGRIQNAIKLFELNVDAYPNSGDVYNCLGEAHMLAGNKKEAIKNYKKSLALDPNNMNSLAMLKKLSE